MALIATDNRKQYELAPSGQYLGVLADVVDLGVVKTNFGEKLKCRLVWLLAKIDNTGYALDKEGQPLRVMGEYTVSMNERSTLFQTIRSIIGTNPPAGPYDVEQLIGRNNLLFVVQEASAKDAAKVYANVKGILPVPAGLNLLGIPPTFKRFTPRQQQAQAQPVATQPAPFTPAVAAQAVSSAVAPAPYGAPAGAPIQAAPAIAGSPVQNAQAQAPAVDVKF